MADEVWTSCWGLGEAPDGGKRGPGGGPASARTPTAPTVTGWTRAKLSAELVSTSASSEFTEKVLESLVRLGLSLRPQAETLGTASTGHAPDRVWKGDDHAIPRLRSGQSGSRGAGCGSAPRPRPQPLRAEAVSEQQRPTCREPPGGPSPRWPSRQGGVSGRDASLAGTQALGDARRSLGSRTIQPALLPPAETAEAARRPTTGGTDSRAGCQAGEAVAGAAPRLLAPEGASRQALRGEGRRISVGRRWLGGDGCRRPGAQRAVAALPAPVSAGAAFPVTLLRLQLACLFCSPATSLPVQRGRRGLSGQPRGAGSASDCLPRQARLRCVPWSRPAG